jgi:hypothetical protein
MTVQAFGVVLQLTVTQMPSRTALLQTQLIPQQQFQHMLLPTVPMSQQSVAESHSWLPRVQTSNTIQSNFKNDSTCHDTPDTSQASLNDSTPRREPYK